MAKKQIEPDYRGIHSAPLNPIRVVVRELTRPDGKKLRVEVPVYPPFQLEGSGDRIARGAAAGRTPEKTALQAPRARKGPKPRKG